MRATADRTAALSRYTLSRYTLGNGLRVVLAHRPGAATVAVSVHYGVGHRSERPGEEGLAHLFEHLMTQDRHGETTSAKLTTALAVGGSAGATTHQDYTDFFQAVPAAELETVLHWEADRMRAPRFSRDHLRAQVRGVADEIAGAVYGRPYGGFPWPALPATLFRTFANRHDGYGDASALAGVTFERCQDFFTAYYTPGNAVLTVVGDVGDRAAGTLIHRYFEPLPRRPDPPRPALREPALEGDLVARVEVAGQGPAVAAVGYRLPDPAGDLDGYLAHVVLAELLSDPCGYPPPARATATRVTSASCGFFGALDARDPDVLVIVGGPISPGTPEDLTAIVDRRLEDLAAGRVPDPVLAAAARRAALSYGRRLADPTGQCRAIGRCELLFGRAELVGELHARLAGVHPADIAAEAAKLRSRSRAVLIAVPVGQRSAPVVEPAGPSSDPAARLPDFQVLRAPLTAPEPRYAGLDDRTLGAGHRVTAIAHPASAGVEARLCLVVPDPDPRLAARLASVIAKAAGGSDSAIQSSAGAITLSRFLDPGALPHWLRRVSSLLRDRFVIPDRRGAASDEPRPQISVQTLADQLCQIRYLGLQWGADPPPASPCAAARAELVLVGSGDPRRLADLAADALDGITGPGPIGPPPVSARGPGDLLLVPRPASQASVALRAPQPPGGAGDAAHHLLIALLSGVGSLHRGGRSRLGMFAGSGLVVGRDVVAGHTSSFLGGTFAPADSAAVLRRLHHEVAGEAPVLDEAEVGRVRDLCAGQWLAAFDDPCYLADTVLQQIGFGRSPGELPSFASQLRRASLADLAAAWDELRAGDPFTGVLVGDVPEESLTDRVPWPVTIG